MNKYILLLLLIIPFILISKPRPKAKDTILINIKSKSILPPEFEETVSTILEDDFSYELVEPLQVNDFAIDAEEEYNFDCKTKDCYKVLYKKVKSKFMISFLVKSVPSIYSKKYRFRLVLMNLETAEKEGEKSFFLKARLSNVSSLVKFSKKIVPNFFLAIDKDKAVEELARLKKIPETLNKKDVLDMVREIYPDVKACGKKHNAKGIVKIHLILNNDKTISDIKFVTEVKSDLMKCLLVVVKQMRVKEFKGRALPLIFPFKLD